MNTPPYSRPRRDAPRSFTLLELIVSSTLMTIVLGATTSVVVIASRSMSIATHEARDVELDAIISDILFDFRFATRIRQHGLHDVTIIVPDRPHDGDNTPERIRYTWSGIPGDPVTRTYNAETTTIIPAASDFRLYVITDFP